MSTGKPTTRCGGAPGGSGSTGRSPPRTRPSCARSSRRGAATICSDERERGECRLLVLLAPWGGDLAELLEWLEVGELVTGNERARDTAVVQCVDDRPSVERAFGRVQQRVRREDLVERARELDVVAHDRRAADRDAARSGPRAPLRSPRPCARPRPSSSVARSAPHRTPSAARRDRRNAPASPERGPDPTSRPGPGRSRPPRPSPGPSSRSTRARSCDRSSSQDATGP